MNSRAASDIAKIKSFLSKPGIWAKGYYAFDRKGQQVSTKSPDACQFCMVGASKKVGAESDWRRYVRLALKEKGVPNIPHTSAISVTQFNDSKNTTLEDVIEVLTIAERLAK